MPLFGPINRRELVRVLQQAGYSGPYAGGKHAYMIKGVQKVYIPNPHQGAIGRNLLARILQQAGISRDEWERL